MTLGELKTILSNIPQEYNHVPVLVDTEAVEFKAHMVDITDIYTLDKDMADTLGLPTHVRVSLDDSAKRY